MTDSEATGAGVRVTIVPSADPVVAAAERELDAAGFALPLQSRVAWAARLGGLRDFTALAHDDSGRCLAALGLSVTDTRALPGHTIVRAESLGEPYATAAGREMLRAITARATTSARVLRVVVELECRDEAARHHLREMLVELGWRRVPEERVSARTLAIELHAGEEAILASFGRSTRQNIRAAAKHDLELTPLADPSLAPAMNALLAASLARTGAPAQRMEWASVMALCHELPHRSRLIGVFRGAGRQPQDLVGFCWGLHHGRRVEYHTGASARVPGVRLPILYPALWDLITWGTRTGGEWFDLGGVTEGHVGSSDALGGISDFKRGFSRVEVALGEEWVFEPSPLKARVAAAASDAAKRLRGIVRKARRAVPPAPARSNGTEAAPLPIPGGTGGHHEADPVAGKS